MLKRALVRSSTPTMDAQGGSHRTLIDELASIACICYTGTSAACASAVAIYAGVGDLSIIK